MGRGWLAAVVMGAAVWLAAAPAAEAQTGTSPRGARSADVKEALRLNDEAVALFDAGKYDPALPLAQRSLTMFESALGPDHLAVAACLITLASLYERKGEYGHAEPLCLRALAIYERVLGPDHLDTARSLGNLAWLYNDKGEYDRAEPLYLRALAIREKALGPDHPDVASTLNQLASLYEEKRAYGRAEPLYLRALAIREKALSPDHPDVATSLNNLALLYELKGEYDRAEPLYLRALTIREKALGPDHPDVASTLGNLASLYKRKGEYERAEPLYLRALSIDGKALRPDNPNVAATLGNLSILYWATGRLPETLSFLSRSHDVEEKALARVFATGSEAQRRAYLATFSGSTQLPVTLALQTRHPQAARLALTTLLRRKGRVLDATAAGFAGLRARLGAGEQTLLDDLAAARARYTALVLRGPSGASLTAYQSSLVSTSEQIREREIVVGVRSAALRVEEQPATVAAVQAALPEGAALVEWTVYEPFNPRARAETEKWAFTRYAACVLPKRGEPVWIDLGDTSSIDDAMDTFRAALRRPANTEVLSLGRALDARIMAPIRALLGATHRVLLSPDGGLNLLPFAALIGEDNQPLIERYAFTYLTSGRDLLRFAVPTPPRGAPLVLASPEFDAAGDRPGAGRFFPLLHAEEEAATVARLFPDTAVRLHGDATKQSLREAHGPRLLHIGTHGYFEPIACMTDPRNASEAQSDALANPLLRSGIALAGANACAGGHDEGLLTAFEASGLDLYGTKLVVLSACQTGMGNPTAGEGVYGLRRALVLAGAETQVMSLWPVDGAATAYLMKAYYEALANGGGRSEAMRGVQLAMLHDPRWSHPYFWAPFIVSGDDRSLTNKAVLPDFRVHPGGACTCRQGGAPSAGNAPFLIAAAALALGFIRRRARRGAARRSKTWRGWLAALMVGAAVWLGAAPMAEAQTGKGTSASNAADVQEATRLRQQFTPLYEAGKYDAALPVAQRVLDLLEKALGPDHLDVATALNDLAVVCEARGEYGRAEALHQRALAIRESALGPDHVVVAVSLNNLAVLFITRGQYDRAEPLCVRALSILERAQGANQPEVAFSLNSLARLYGMKGQYGRAEPLFQRALAIRERTLGPGHPDVATSLNNLALNYQEKGELGRAEPLLQRALAIQEKALGQDHPDVATSLNSLASLYQAKGEYGRAEPLFQRALAIVERALGPNHSSVAASLNSLAFLYDEMGEYSRAEPLYQRALSVREKALGPAHPQVATTLNNLAGIYQAKGEYGRAEPLYQRALSILEIALGPSHPRVAFALSNFAAFYETKGDYSRAEPLYQRALDILEGALGPDHSMLATVLNNLAVLYQKKGEYVRSAAMEQRVLAIKERALGPDHPDVALALNNLAAIYQIAGEYDRAQSLYERSLTIMEGALGPDHPSVALALNNLGVLYTMKGENDRAEPFLQRALLIQEKALGPNHPDVATSLNNLANVYRARNELDRVEPLYQRALSIQERSLGPDHPSMALYLENLGLLYWMTGRFPEATHALTRSEDAEEKTLGRVLAAGSEAQKRAYLATLSDKPSSFITFALQTHDPEVARLALTTILRRKGRVLDATTGGLRALRARLGTEEQKLLDDLSAARARYVTLVLRGPGATPLDAYRTSLGQLDEQIRARESAISARSMAFQIEQQPVTIAAVQAAMPEDAALVEWAVYRPFNPKGRTEREKGALPRYAVCVLPRHGDPVWIDLGDAKSIDDDIQTFRAALRRPANTQVNNLARFLEARIMSPVRDVLRTTRRVLLSPDGALNLIPFAALIGEDDRPLIERYSFTYLTSGRDLLRLSVPTPTRGAPLVLADPDFDAPGIRPGAGRFFPLLHAEEEAASVARFFPGTTVRLHGDATKQSLREARGPRLLHIGTHGYFELTVCMADPQRAGEAQAAALANPLLHSGIALAGANACASGNDEGLLTAFEASGLDLYGTKLVVLSACQTGVGDAQAGDGVYGLRRALVLAGAETQVMSLWPVDGAATTELMKAYYEALARGGRRSESMRGVQLAMLHDRRWSHPYYWASFIVSGDDRRLDENVQPPDLRVHPGGACACRQSGAPPAGNAPFLTAVAVLALGLTRRLARRGGGGSPREAAEGARSGLRPSAAAIP